MSQLMSEQIDQLATALAKAQGEMPVAGKNQKNPFFKSNYADFEAIIEASRPALTKYGLSVVQSPSMQENNESYLITILMHSSGQWVKSTAHHNPPKNDIQSLSSYNTYLKRMCYTSLICVATGDDDDGEKAMDRNNQYQPKQEFNKPQDVIKPAQQIIIERISTDQLEVLEKELDGHAEIKDSVLEVFGIKSLKDMHKSKFLSSLNQIKDLVNREKDYLSKK